MLIYDKEVFQLYRDQAVTDSSKLEIGKRYYTNSGTSFVCKGVITDFQHYQDIGLDPKGCREGPSWILTEKDKTLIGGSVSCADNNIGASYNPWLIFDNEGLASECEERLTITFERDVDDIFDTWYDDYPEEGD